MGKKLKYHSKIDRNCDLSVFKENKRVAYRWVFKKITDSRNFIPPYKRDSNRKDDKCRLWCLSFFDSESNAKKKLARIIEHKPLIFKKLGTHIAKGKLNEHDGIMTDIEKHGHFDLFEFEKVDLSKKFKVIGASH